MKYDALVEERVTFGGTTVEYSRAKTAIAMALAEVNALQQQKRRIVAELRRLADELETEHQFASETQSWYDVISKEADEAQARQ